MSTMMHSSKFEDDTAPLVTLEGVHIELTSLKQEQCSPTADLPLQTYTSAPIHPLTQEMNFHSAGNSWESEHFKATRRYSTGASQSYLRNHLPPHKSGTGDQPFHTMATSPPRHAHYERVPSARMIGRRHHLMLRRGEKGTNEWSGFTGASVAASTKGQKYQKMLDDRAHERKEEQEVDEEEEDSSEKRSEVVDRVSAFKKRRSWSGSLQSAFTFAPYQSF